MHTQMADILSLLNNSLLKSLGYRTIDIYGAKLGAYSRQEKLTTEDFEMLVIAQM